jgi:putative lipoprotein
LTGILTYSEDLLLPAGAVAEVRLVDVTIEEAPELEIQKVVIPNPGQKPIPFGVPYYPSTIIDTRSYALRAEVRDQNGDIMFVNSVDYPVITQGRPVQGITLLLEYVVKGMIVSPFDRVH